MPKGLFQETCRPSRVASPKLVFVEIGPSKGRIVRNPGLDPIVRARDRPAIPENHVADGPGDRGFIGPEKDVGNLLVEQENEIKPAPAQIETAWTACPARPVDDAREPSITPDDVA